jgi:carboxylate-amine ligase
LGSRDAISIIPKIFESGTGADRQLKVYEKNESLVDVVDYIHEQFLYGL